MKGYLRSVIFKKRQFRVNILHRLVLKLNIAIRSGSLEQPTRLFSPVEKLFTQLYPTAGNSRPSQSQLRAESQSYLPCQSNGHAFPILHRRGDEFLPHQISLIDIHKLILVTLCHSYNLRFLQQKSIIVNSSIRACRFPSIPNFIKCTFDEVLIHGEVLVVICQPLQIIDSFYPKDADWMYQFIYIWYLIDQCSNTAVTDKDIILREAIGRLKRSKSSDDVAKVSGVLDISCWVVWLRKLREL